MEEDKESLHDQSTRSEKNKIKWKVVGPDEQNQQNKIANIE